MRAKILETAARMPVPVFNASGFDVGYAYPDDAGAFDYAGAAMNLGKAAVAGGKNGGVGGALESAAHAGTDMAAAAVGAAVGGALGSVIGPVGTVIGGLAGSLVAKAGSWFVGWLGNKLKNTGKGKKTVPFAKSLAKKDPKLFAQIKKAPAALALLKKDPFHLYAPKLATTLKQQFSTKLAAAKSVAKRRSISQGGQPPRPTMPRTPAAASRPASVVSVFSPASTGAARVASALTAYPGLRGLPTAQLASALGVSSGDALGGMSSLLARAGMSSDVRGGESMDAALIRGGRPRAPAWGAQRMLVMPHLLDLIRRGHARPRFRRNDAGGPDTPELTYRVTSPQTLRDVAMVCSPTHDGNRWPELVARNPELNQTSPDEPLPDGELPLPEGWVSPTAGPVPPPPYVPGAPIPDMGQGGPMPGHRYRVRDGDTGQKISALYTGDVNRWRELRDANPGSDHPEWGFKANVGQVITIPASWPELVSAGPVSMPAPQVPSWPSGGGSLPLPGGGSIPLPSMPSGPVSLPLPGGGSLPAPPVGGGANPGPFPGDLPNNIPVSLPGKVGGAVKKSSDSGGAGALLLIAAAVAMTM